MIIYRLKPDLRFHGLTFEDDQNFLLPWEGLVKRLSALAPSFKVISSDENANLRTIKFPDLVDFSQVGCISVKAWAILQANLALAGDTVELIYDQEGVIYRFVLFEPKGWFDCLDFERSEVQYFDAARTRVKWVDHLVVRNVGHVDKDIFRITHLLPELFCTERCAQVVKKHKLKGFVFYPIEARE